MLDKPHALSIANGLASLLLLLAMAAACMLAISVNEGRTKEVQELQRRSHLNSIQISGLSGKPDAALELTVLQGEAKQLTDRIGDVNFRIIYGDREAREKRLDGIANRFVAMSNATNTMIIATCACAIAFAVTRIRSRKELVLLDVLLGVLSGLLALFIVKGGGAMFEKTVVGNIDVQNPYGIAFFAALVGLFMDKFYAYLGSIVPNAK